MGKSICPNCHKNSLVRSTYKRKIDGASKTVDICFTKGCGYRKDHNPEVPSIRQVKEAKEIAQGQVMLNL